MLPRLLITALLLLAAPLVLADDEIQAGRDYFLIEPAQPTQADGKIEVLEVFGYSCIHCANAAPAINEWRKGLAADVKFDFLPAVFGGVWEAFGRAYYAAEATGVLEKSHDRIFEIVHSERRNFGSLDDIAAAYTEFGVDKQAFLGTMSSFAVNAKIAQAQNQARAYGIEGTPSMIINGKYRVVAPTGDNSFARMLDVVDHLIAKERAAAKAG